jgi:hypothetical protein
MEVLKLCRRLRVCEREYGSSETRALDRMNGKVTISIISEDLWTTARMNLSRVNRSESRNSTPKAKLQTSNPKLHQQFSLKSFETATLNLLEALYNNKLRGKERKGLFIKGCVAHSWNKAYNAQQRIGKLIPDAGEAQKDVLHDGCVDT